MLSVPYKRFMLSVVAPNKSVLQIFFWINKYIVVKNLFDRVKDSWSEYSLFQILV